MSILVLVLVGWLVVGVLVAWLVGTVLARGERMQREARARMERRGV